MVFHSFEFIVGFLPLCYLGFLLAHRIAGWTGAFRFLAAASIAFYAQWSMALLSILLASVFCNYLAGSLIMRLSQHRTWALATLLAAIAGNVAALLYFKYTNFLIDIANSLGGAGYSHVQLLLPVGMSFYTFVQIGYLVEAYNGQVERPDFGRYALFATFLPCVTAGPLVLQREMLEQMRGREDQAFDARRLALGLTMFMMGLFKKVFLADSIAPYANSAFDGVAAGQAIAALAAWIGSTAYALQLYFDFSGYSDMAIGLGVIFGLKLPLNFDSPFKATNISDFWRRWHVTMTRFFTNFIYTPMAMRGMRASLGKGSGKTMRFLRTAALPSIVTFLVAGVWHGAGWNFVIYGLIHGFAIAICLGWRELGVAKLPPVAGWLLTMGVVVSGLVVFRAPDLGTAAIMLAGMWSFGLAVTPEAGQAMVALDIRTALSMIVILGAIVLLMPNTQQILHRDWVSTDARPASAGLAAGLLAWRPGFGASLALGATSCLTIASIGAGTTFLYYQF
jgi:D-alanyl-lipoteichoic acid acyltransferase DltB (MBOAT superfamily)